MAVHLDNKLKRLLRTSRERHAVCHPRVTTAPRDVVPAGLVSTPHTGTEVDVLLLAEQLTQALYGMRLTSCKSAKDRTAMSVTAEQAQLLAAEWGIPATEAESFAARMRREGVRLHNTRKNTGRSAYAFSRLQRQWLPQRFAPPEGTFARGRS